MSPEKEQKCPKCGALYSGNFCGDCGADLRGKICRKCGKRTTTRFCETCGYDNESQEENNKSITQIRTQKPNYIASYALDILIALFILGGVFTILCKSQIINIDGLTNRYERQIDDGIYRIVSNSGIIVDDQV